MSGETILRDPQAQLEDLRKVAENLSIDIEYSDLSDNDVAIQSGYCKVNGQEMIILDKNLPAEMQVVILLKILRDFNLDNAYIAAWIREHFESGKDS